MDVRVMVSARGRAQADAQGRGDGAGSVTDRQTRTLRRSLRVFVLLHQGGEAPERRPWASQRERPPGGFCRAPQGGFSVEFVACAGAVSRGGGVNIRTALEQEVVAVPPRR